MAEGPPASAGQAVVVLGVAARRRAAAPPAPPVDAGPRVVVDAPGKRAFDLVTAALLLCVLAPLLLLAMAAIRLYDGGPALFRQRRVGRDGRPFEILKLRTMVVGADRWAGSLRNDADGLLFKMCGDPRVTPVGRVLRRVALDELPQLVNVLRGEMSLVGPRPLPVEPSSFGTFDGFRHVVPPGITGPWQVRRSDGFGYAEMIELDLAYIRGWSMWLDVRLLLRTVPAVLRRREAV